MVVTNANSFPRLGSIQVVLDIDVGSIKDQVLGEVLKRSPMIACVNNRLRKCYILEVRGFKMAEP